MNTEAKRIWENLKQIRHKKPLIHNITNYVVMNNTANALLAIGASPVMAHAEEETADMVNIASALTVNIGTLSSSWVKGMKTALQAASARQIPIVFDPVGVGATPYRNKTCRELLDLTKPAIIRGNPSEIMALEKIFNYRPEAEHRDDLLGLEHRDEEKDEAAGNGGITRGVDSTESSDSALDAAVSLSQKLGCIVSVSGEIDFVVEGEKVRRIGNGNELMPLVTGLGCTATCITAAFAAVNNSLFEAAVHAMVVMGIAGEIAAEESLGPGSMQVEFIDALYLLDEDQIISRIKIS